MKEDISKNVVSFPSFLSFFFSFSFSFLSDEFALIVELDCSNNSCIRYFYEGTTNVLIERENTRPILTRYAGIKRLPLCKTNCTGANCNSFCLEVLCFHKFRWIDKYNDAHRCWSMIDEFPRPVHQSSLILVQTLFMFAKSLSASSFLDPFKHFR